MSHDLKKELATLAGFVQQIAETNLIANATKKDAANVQELLKKMVEQIALLNEEADEIAIAIEVRDLNIRSLGEKLADLHEASPQNVPFVVKKERRLPECKSHLFKSEEASQWDF